MIVATSPEGVRVQFNAANYANRHHDAGYCDLYDKKGGEWQAQVPLTWLLEVVVPCKVSKVTSAGVDALREVADLLERKPGTSGREDEQLRRIKRALAKWDARSGSFR